MLEFQLNPIGFSNWEELHTLLCQSFAYMEGRIDPPSSLSRMSPKSLKEKANEEILLIVTDGDKLAACAYLKKTPDSIYVGKVAVAQSHQKRGIAREIFKLAEDYARANDKSSLELQTRVELFENHQVFERLGFVISGRSSHDGYDSPTTITMSKEIP